MPRSGPRKVRKYSDEFKWTAVRLSQPPGIQVQTVAAALEIHPFMLSKWRKDVRDGRIRGRAPKARVAGPAREIAQLAALEQAYATLQEEHDLLKKPSGSVPLERRRLRVHPHAAGALRDSGPLSAVWRHGEWLLCVVSSRRQCACGAGPVGTAGDCARVCATRRAIWQSADLSGAPGHRVGGESPSRRATHAGERPAR